MFSHEHFSPDALLDVNAIFLGRDLSASLGVDRGDRVTVRGVRRFSGRAGRKSLVAPDMAAAQVHFTRLGRLDRVDLVTPSDVSVDRVMRELRDLLGPSVSDSPSSRRHGPAQSRLTSARRLLSPIGRCG